MMEQMMSRMMEMISERMQALEMTQMEMISERMEALEELIKETKASKHGLDDSKTQSDADGDSDESD